MDLTALALTARLAAATTAVLAALGLPLAYWLATTPRRAVRVVVESVVALPLVLPPTVLGFYLLEAMGPHGVVGSATEALFGSRLPFTFAGILVGSVLYNLPFAVRPFAAAIRTVDRRLIEASWCLGVSAPRTVTRVVLPLAWPGILAGLVLTFAHAVGEFGVVLMLGGNIPGVTRTLSIALYDDVQAFDDHAASATALLLLAFAFVVLALTHLLERRLGPRVAA